MAITSAELPPGASSASSKACRRMGRLSGVSSPGAAHPCGWASSVYGSSSASTIRTMSLQVRGLKQVLLLAPLAVQLRSSLILLLLPLLLCCTPRVHTTKHDPTAASLPLPPALAG
jgi:hypothetical protein